MKMIEGGNGQGRESGVGDGGGVVVGWWPARVAGMPWLLLAKSTKLNIQTNKIKIKSNKIK